MSPVVVLLLFRRLKGFVLLGVLLVDFLSSVLSLFVLFLSGLVIMTFSSLPSSECPKNVTVTGVVHLLFVVVSSVVLVELRFELVFTGVVLVGPVTDKVSLSPPWWCKKRVQMSKKIKKVGAWNVTELKEREKQKQT